MVFINRKVMLSFLGLLFFASGVFAENENTHSVSIHSLIGEALVKSPSVQSKKAEYEAARSKVIREWLPEDPMVGVDVEGQSDLFDFGGRINNEYMVEQTIPFPAKLHLKGILATKEADIAYQKYKEEERSIIWHVEQPYYELYGTKKTLEATEESQKLLENILSVARARYESSQVSQQDLLNTQIELSKKAIEIFDLKEKMYLQGAHFAHILNQALDTRYEIKDMEKRSPFLYALPQLEVLALQKRPELKAFEIGIERSKTARSLNNTEWLPDITLRYEGRQFRGDDSISEHDAFIGLSFPFWSLIKGAGGSWKSADLDVESAESLYIKMKNEVLLSIHEAYSKLKSAENALNTYESSILPDSKQQVEIALASYEAGRTDMIALLDAQRTLTNAQIDYYKAVSEYEMALSDLRFSVGDDLPR